MNVYFYREFVKELKQAMKSTPKMAMRHCTFDYDKVRPSFSAETRINMPGFGGSGAAIADSGSLGAIPRSGSFVGVSSGGSGSDTEGEPEKKKSQYLLRIEHEQRLMPAIRGRGRRGRGRGRGKGKGKARKR